MEELRGFSQGGGTEENSKLYKYNDILVNIMNDIYSSNENILSNNAVKLIKKIVKK